MQDKLEDKLEDKLADKLADKVEDKVEDKPVVIIGAGVVGLTLAHGLAKAGIRFGVYERDRHIDARGQGWAITLHWALPLLERLLDGETLAAVEATQVDAAMGEADRGNFLFLNLATLEPKFRIPTNKRRRVNRERLRKALLARVAPQVHWAKQLVGVEARPDGVTARFADGSSVDAALVVGAEGSNSTVRRLLFPSCFANHQLPVRVVGASVELPPHDAQPLRAIDPLLFHGCHPETGLFLWVSLLATPATTASGLYRYQVLLSWRLESPADELPPSDAARVALMKQRAHNLHPTLRRLVDALDAHAPVLQVVAQDWPPPPAHAWDNRHGRLTLAGDAAHAMTMYRGEAGNHGILDAVRLCAALEAVSAAQKTLPAAIDEYEAELTVRTAPAVLLSRQACLDAHDFAGLNEESAVLKKRALNLPLGLS
ncbi:hypothetical protein CDD81_2842 [Ophiocordyceps australis]|uniref:FAD-binding domain-containing protein n=1 Tax=Ophiocordyceps australis TaxID=1399860 RepID=A0A2C5XSY4_9HYPO|nr:hypothetical protein CDD81_2842 [Ophiocordyceps australis]